MIGRFLARGFTRLERLSPSARVGLILGVLLFALFLLIGKAENDRRGGTLVVLATAPVDPRSLMQGDYVTLRYDISSISENLLEGGRQETPVIPGQTLYVVLKQEEHGPVWRAQRASFTRPALQPGEKIIRGTVAHAVFPLRVAYGLEAFFVPEGEGKWVEQLPRQHVTVRARVREDGTATMDTLLVNGQPVFEPAGF